MLLHKRKDYFIQAIQATSNNLNIAPALVEKDYFLTLFLKQAKEEIPGLVFKGGTSLSKCFNLIDRFSEDIDLTLDVSHFTQSYKRNSIRNLITLCSKLDFNLLNKDKIEKHTHGNYNCFEIRYPLIFFSDYIKPELKIEMTYIQKSFPTEQKTMNSYIGNYFQKNGNNNVVKEYLLEPFAINVQSLSRTLIDKIFALCDYYLSSNILRNSRHIYDISSLLTKVDVTSFTFIDLFKRVKEERKRNKNCLSAQDNVDIYLFIKSIIETNIFKNDYEEVTMKLLTKPVSYYEAVESLKMLLNSKLFE